MTDSRKKLPLAGGAFATTAEGVLEQLEPTTKPPVGKSIAAAEAAAAAKPMRQRNRTAAAAGAAGAATAAGASAE